MKISLWNREKVTIELFRKQFTMLRGNTFSTYILNLEYSEISFTIKLIEREFSIASG